MAPHHPPAVVVSPSPDAAPFWEACLRRELLLPRCSACDTTFFYPRTSCPSCGSRAVGWVAASGRGRVYTFCIHHQASLPAFRDAVPFVTVIVELEEGPRLMSFLTGVEPDPGSVRCDMPVHVDFTELEDGRLLPVFRPAEEVS
jgi:uncharacterized protein